MESIFVEIEMETFTQTSSILETYRATLLAKAGLLLKNGEFYATRGEKDEMRNGEVRLSRFW